MTVDTVVDVIPDGTGGFRVEHRPAAIRPGAAAGRGTTVSRARAAVSPAPRRVTESRGEAADEDTPALPTPHDARIGVSWKRDAQPTPADPVADRGAAVTTRKGPVDAGAGAVSASRSKRTPDPGAPDSSERRGVARRSSRSPGALLAKSTAIAPPVASVGPPSVTPPSSIHEGGATHSRSSGGADALRAESHALATSGIRQRTLFTSSTPHELSPANSPADGLAYRHLKHRHARHSAVDSRHTMALPVWQ